MARPFVPSRRNIRMPLYEFRCPNGHDFERFYRSINTAAAEERCPVCGAIAARQMSLAGLVFKGSGFYITDYGKDGKKAEREAATAEKTKAEAATAAKTAEAKTGESTASAAESAAATKPKAAEPAPAAGKQSSPAPATVKSRTTE